MLAQGFSGTKLVHKCGNDNSLLFSSVPTVFTYSINYSFPYTIHSFPNNTNFRAIM